MRNLAALVFLVCAPVSADDSPLVAALKDSRSTFHMSGTAIEGPARAVLADAAQESQFFLIGEDHGAAETPRFAQAMFDIARPFGYRHIAVEAGPITAEMLESMARRPNGIDEIASFSRAHPFALPFFNWREESEYLVSAVRSSPARHVVWGLDQEFMTSSGFHLERLAALAKSSGAKRLVGQLRERSQSGFDEMRRTKNPRAALLSTMTDSEFQQLADAFPRNPEALRIIGELRASAAIYQRWFTPGENFRANQERDELMKRHFIAAYKRAQAEGEAAPRVLMKFGASHMVRGRSMVNTFDLGTFLPEVAAFNGGRAFSVLLLARGGHVNALTPFSSDDSDRNHPYDPAKTRNLDIDPAPFFDAAAGGEWTLFDLRKVRPKVNRTILGDDIPLQRVIYGFDAVVVIPEATAATSW